MLRGFEGMNLNDDHEDVKWFLNKLQCACESIGKEYFTFQSAVENEGTMKYKERVYAYELYHQLRCNLYDRGYTLHGEYFKHKTPLIPNNIRGKSPDLIVHVPESNSENLAVIEIKRVDPFYKSEVMKDLNKLSSFLNKPTCYKIGIELFFGEYDLNAFKRKIEEFLINDPKIFKGTKEKILQNRILIFLHGGPGEKPRIVKYG